MPYLPYILGAVALVVVFLVIRAWAKRKRPDQPNNPTSHTGLGRL